jgi:hypothetical protein
MGEWVQTFISVFPRTGEMRPGSTRILRSSTPPPAGPEDWPRPRKFTGSATWIVPLVSMASDTWHICYREVIALPRELADELLLHKRARLARDSEIPIRDE